MPLEMGLISQAEDSRIWWPTAVQSFKRFCWAQDSVESLISKLGRKVCFMSYRFGMGKILVISRQPIPIDFDGDGRSDIAVYRDGAWFILRSSDGRVRVTGWGGLPQDIPVPADYDGEGEVDIAVYRDGAWYIIRSSDGGVTMTSWGGLLTDIPVPADYDGDGKADVAVYRGGTWFIIRSSDGGFTVTGWGGLAQEITVPADYDGDGRPTSRCNAMGRGSSSDLLMGGRWR